jgi:predicted nucleotide-binding protein
LTKASLQEAWNDFQAAAQDAVNADYREAHDTLGRLIATLDEEPLGDLVQRALPPVDFPAWLDATIATIRSVVGSGRISWPADKESRVALQLALVRALVVGERISVDGLLMNFYTTKFNQGYADFLSKVLRPFLRDLARVLENKRNSSLTPQSAAGAQVTQSRNTKAVFVVHGRNTPARDALFQFLRAIGLHPLEWTEAVALTGSASPYVGAVLEKAFAEAQAVVVLMTGDDEAQLRAPLHGVSEEQHELRLMPQARPNVLFEAGLAFGVHPERTVLVELGKLRPFSDIGGRHTVRITNQTERRQDLAMRLRNAGCDVNLDGTDWHRAGDFDATVK